jgi:hypothetical protein
MIFNSLLNIIDILQIINNYNFIKVTKIYAIIYLFNVIGKYCFGYGAN